jgi:hypothetical protein
MTQLAEQNDSEDEFFNAVGTGVELSEYEIQYLKTIVQLSLSEDKQHIYQNFILVMATHLKRTEPGFEIVYFELSDGDLRLVIRSDREPTPIRLRFDVHSIKHVKEPWFEPSIFH